MWRYVILNPIFLLNAYSPSYIAQDIFNVKEQHNDQST